MKCWASNRSRHIAFFSGFLGVAVVALAHGIAQAQAPIPLRPPSELAPATPLPPVTEEYPAETENDGISTGALGQLDFASVGILTADSGGFGPQTWQGADRALVERLLPKLPVTTHSPTLQKLMRRLLLSTAEPPQGTSTGASFIGLRLERLIKAGHFEQAAQMSALAGGPTRDEALLQARAEIALASNEFKQACDMAAAQVRASEAVFWLKLTGFCQIINGDEAATQLTASLVAEQEPDDTGYQRLLAALISKSGRLPENLPHLDILQLAMIRFASLPLPEKIDDHAAPAVLKLMARMPGASVQQRLPAAERAEAAGAIGPQEVAQLYSEMPFTVEDRAGAAELATTLPPAQANALLFQSVRGQDSTAGLTLALSAAWRLARASNSFATVSRVNLTPIRDLVPAPEMIEIAAEAGRALLLAGDPLAATRWYDLARALSIPGNNPAATRAKNDLWPLLRLAQPVAGIPEDPLEITAWLAQLSPEDKTRKGPILLSAMSALDMATPESEWVAMAQDTKKTDAAAMPPAALLHLLMEASQSGRVGQTVLLSLACLGENGAGLTDPLLLGITVRALNTVGLQTEARALALEAALQAGI